MFKNLFLIIPVCLLAACSNNEPRNRKNVDPEAIFFDYRVWGSEEIGDVTVRLQYFMGDLEGSTVLWQHPASVEFDGEILTADSSKMNGFYYEAQIPLENFPGKHSVVLTDHHEEKYTEEFDFSAFSLKTEPPAVINRTELVLGLSGLDSADILRVLLNDTSFYGRGIDRMDTVKNDSIIITPRDLENLKNGPVFLEIFKESGRPLKQPGKAGGRLSLSYSIKRAFELRD